MLFVAPVFPVACTGWPNEKPVVPAGLLWPNKPPPVEVFDVAAGAPNENPPPVLDVCCCCCCGCDCCCDDGLLPPKEKPPVAAPVPVPGACALPALFVVLGAPNENPPPVVDVEGAAVDPVPPNENGLFAGGWPPENEDERIIAAVRQEKPGWKVDQGR